MKYRYCNRKNDANTMLSVVCSDGRLYLSSGIKRQHGEFDSLTGYSMTTDGHTYANYKLMEFRLGVREKYAQLFAEIGAPPTRSELKELVTGKGTKGGISLNECMTNQYLETESAQLKSNLRSIMSCLSDDVAKKRVASCHLFSKVCTLPEDALSDLKKSGKYKDTVIDAYMSIIFRSIREFHNKSECFDSRYLLAIFSSYEYIEAKAINRSNDFGYIYLVSSEYGYKIGMSKRPKHRNNVFGVKIPFKTKMDRVIGVNEYKKVESIMHELFKGKRINGEWFDLTEDDIEAFDSEIKKYIP